MPESLNKRQSSPKHVSKEKTKGKVARDGSKDVDSVNEDSSRKLRQGSESEEHTTSNDPNSDEFIPETDNDDAQPLSRAIETKPPPLKDVMRQEPVLLPLVVLRYEGDQNELGFYHGEGFAEFCGGHTYKGSFEDGKMHGEGTYTWSYGICYVGDFKKNIITGIGKYFWPDGSMYQGEVCDGKRHGKGTYQCAVSQSIYEGAWVSGKRNGEGVLYFNKNLDRYYDGYWVNNKKCGHGVMVYKSGNKYDGNWSNDLRHGKGQMHWYDRGEEYRGDWNNGAMTGFGTYTWYIYRTANSQYPLRNQYLGQFVNGIREGRGTFHYASGASYAGDWKDNKKHGQGKFTFKNGLTFDGFFEFDRIVGHPDVVLSGFTTPDINNSDLPVRSITPIRSDTPTGTTDSIEINLGPLFEEHMIDIEFQVKETEEVSRILLQHISALRSIYRFYSGLGQDSSADNTYILTLFQMWRLLKDAGLPKLGYSLADIDRAVALTKDSYSTLHYPYNKIFFRDFVNMLIVVAYHVCGDDCNDKGSMFSSSLSKFLITLLLPRAYYVGGSYFSELQNTIAVKPYLDFCYKFYLYFVRGKKFPAYNSDTCLTMRDLLFVLKDLKLVNENLKAKDIVSFLLSEVTDEVDSLEFNLNFELVFLDFLEVMISCSQLFVTDEMCEYFLRLADNGADHGSIIDSPGCDLNGRVQQDAQAEINFGDQGDLGDHISRPAATLTTEQVFDSAEVNQTVPLLQEKSVKSERSDKGEKQERFEKDVSSKEKAKETPKSSDGKGKGRKDERGGTSEKHEKKDRSEAKYSSKKSNEAVALKRDKSKDHNSPISPEGKPKTAMLAKENLNLEKEAMTPPIIVTSSSENHIEEINVAPQIGPPSVTPKDSVPTQDSGHPILKIQSMTSVEMWSLKVKVFIEGYLQTGLEQRKLVDEILEAKKTSS